MRIKSLYVFYREYFGYDKSSKPHFALAIRDAEEAIFQAFQKNKPSNALKDYQGRDFNRQLTIGFLETFLKHLHEYDNSAQLKYYRNSIRIPNNQLMSNKRLDIDFGYCYDLANRNLIFLEYGRVDQAANWFRVFRTLTENFLLSQKLPNIDYVSCWDLLKGAQITLPCVEIEEAPVFNVIETAKRLITQ